MIECGLDEWLDIWLFAPLGKLEKNVEDTSCTMGCTMIVCAIEIVLKDATLESDCVYVCVCVRIVCNLV